MLSYYQLHPVSGNQSKPILHNTVHYIPLPSTNKLKSGDMWASFLVLRGVFTSYYHQSWKYSTSFPQILAEFKLLSFMPKALNFMPKLYTRALNLSYDPRAWPIWLQYIFSVLRDVAFPLMRLDRKKKSESVGFFNRLLFTFLSNNVKL